MTGVTIALTQPERSSSFELLLDVHEEKIKDIIEEISRTLKIPFKVQKLDIGDIQFADLVIERKEINDFFTSLHTARIWSQVSELKHVNGILIIHGLPNPVKAQRLKLWEQLFGFIVSVQLKWGLHCIWLPSRASLKNYLLALIRRKLIELKGVKTYAPYRKLPAKEMREYCENILVQIPSIGIKSAKKLLKEFGSLERIFNASEGDLLRVLNSKQVQSLKAIWQLEYNSHTEDSGKSRR